MKDHTGNELIVGAMYCCVEEDSCSNVDYFGGLVRYVGHLEGRYTFADADAWEECRPDFDKLVIQSARIVDPKTQGW